MKNLSSYILFLSLATLLACNGDTNHHDRRHLATDNSDSLHQFTDDVKLLGAKTRVTVLKDSTGKGAIAITPNWCGQVIGSTTNIEKGRNLGWIDYNGQTGGEDWLVNDTTEFALVQQQKQSVLLEKKNDHIHIQRRITLIARRDVANYLGGAGLHKSVEAVAFESENVFKNTGKQPDDSVFIAVGGYFPAVEDIRLFMPDRELHRFHIVHPDTALNIAFSSAGNYLGYYDGKQDVLTIIQFTMPEGEVTYPDDLVIQFNRQSYVMLSSYSPMAKLKPGGSLQHYHRTIHLSGTPKRLEPVLKKVFGISMKELDATF